MNALHHPPSIRVWLAALGTAAMLSACAVVPESSGLVYASGPPPAPYAETIPVAPFADAVWVGGFWDWDGGRHIWQTGHYEKRRSGFEFHQPAWGHAPDGGWHLDRGGWRTAGEPPHMGRGGFERR